MTGIPAIDTSNEAIDSAPYVSSRALWRGRWLAVWVVSCVFALVGAFLAGTQVRSDQTKAIANAAATQTVTVAVETRTLVVDAAQVFGTVAAGQRIDVIPVGEGPHVVTATLVSPGDHVSSGQVVAEVSGRPIIALDLPFPMYRDLGPGSEGRDVRALQTALQALGMYRGSIDGTYGANTAQAVVDLYRRSQMTPPASPAEASLAVIDGQEAVTAAQGQLVQARTPLPDGSPPDQGAIAGAQAAVAAAKQTLATAQTAALAPLPRSEVLRVPAQGARVEAVAATGTELGAVVAGDVAAVAAGDVADAAALVLMTGTPAVSARVGVAQAPLFTVGATVTLVAVSGASEKAQGVVAEVSEFRVSATEGGGPPGYDVVITISDEPGSVPDASVAGRFVEGAQVTVEPAEAVPTVAGTAVPLTALRSEGSTTYVLVVSDGGSATDKVVVEVEGAADGYAVITGDVSDGDMVVVAAS